MEAEWFKWEEFDNSGDMAYIYHDVTLARDIGDLKSGTWFHWCQIDYENGTLEFWSDPEMADVIKFKMRLEVTPC